MFDLDKAVNEWCLASLPVSCDSAEKIDELTDHLYSEIGRIQKQGFSSEEAFKQATANFGEPETLKAEFAKNRGLLATVWEWEKAHIRQATANSRLSPKQRTALNISISLLFAIAMIVTSLIIPDSDRATLIVYGVLMPLWFVGFYSTLSAGAIECEWRFMQKIIRSFRA